MQNLFWSLRSPRRLVKDIARDLWKGRNILLRVPQGFPSGLIEAVRNTSRDELSHEIVACPALDGRTPFAFLVHEYANEPSKWMSETDALLNDPGFEQRIFWISEMDPVESRAWNQALIKYAQLCQGQALARRMLIVVESSLSGVPPQSNVAMAVFTVDALLDRVDMSVLVADSRTTSGRSALLDEVAISVLVDLAVWDPSVAQYLANLAFEEILSPFDRLHQYAATRNWKPTDNEMELIASGAAVRQNGKLVHHSAYLVSAGRHREVAARVWRGQIRTLFPVVEEIRQTIVSDLDAWLRVRTGQDSAELEIGFIAKVISREFSIPIRHRQLAIACRDIRNRLAHRLIVEVSSLRQLADLIE